MPLNCGSVATIEGASHNTFLLPISRHSFPAMTQSVMPLRPSRPLRPLCETLNSETNFNVIYLHRLDDCCRSHCNTKQCRVTGIIGIFGYHALAVVDTYFNQKVINKNPHLEVLIGGQSGDGKGRFGVASPNRACLGPTDEWQSIARRIGTQHKAKQFA